MPLSPQTTILVLAIVLVAAVLVWRWAQRRRRMMQCLASVAGQAEAVGQLVAEYREITSGRRYASYGSCRGWLERAKPIVDCLGPDFQARWIPRRDSRSASVRDLMTYWEGFAPAIVDYNYRFVRAAAEAMIPTLDSLDIPHSLPQRLAAAVDEDNTLIVAGAGTGKTTAIQAKLTHLTRHLDVDPAGILILSFTRAVAGELIERVGRISPDLTVSTFHAFGLSVVREAEGRSPLVLFEGDLDLQRFINDQFEALLNDHRYCRKAMNWFAYWLYPVTLLPGFETMDDYYRSWRTGERYLTIRKEAVRSQQEAMIANFLYLHGVDYEYERPYEHSTVGDGFHQYRPDFYLTESGAYLEHFGVDRDGHVGFTRPGSINEEASRDYAEQMEWKRNLHRQFGTRLIETFSYEFMEGGWQEQLAVRLKAHGVQLGRIEEEEVRESLQMPENVKGMTQLMHSFLNLLKSGHGTVKEVRARLRPGMVREAAFLDLFEPIHTAYEEHLKEGGGIDFHDMLWRAADHLRAGRYPHRLTHVIVDEFQDISVGKYRLLMALREANPGLKIFSVGDDWQSIYRFAGSDISLMADFEKNFGFTKRMDLEESRRFCLSLAETTNRFITRNPNQIVKSVTSEYDTGMSAVQVVVRKSSDHDAVGDILQALESAAERQSVITSRSVLFSVFVIGRFNLGLHAKTVDADRLRKWSAVCPHLNIEFRTAHSSKGLTADFVVVIDVIAGRYGFPCGIADDPILDMVMGRAEDFPHAEERRLMYVALTRARHKAYLVTDEGRESVFIREFADAGPGSRLRCPECGGRMVARRGRFGAFAGCANYVDGCRGHRTLRSLALDERRSLSDSEPPAAILVPERLKLGEGNFK